MLHGTGNLINDVFKKQGFVQFPKQEVKCGCLKVLITLINDTTKTPQDVIVLLFLHPQLLSLVLALIILWKYPHTSILIKKRANALIQGPQFGNHHLQVRGGIITCQQGKMCPGLQHSLSLLNHMSVYTEFLEARMNIFSVFHQCLAYNRQFIFIG